MTETPQSPRVVALPSVKRGTTGDEESDALFAEAVEAAVRRAIPTIIEYLTQEVLARFESPDVKDSEKK